MFIDARQVADNLVVDSTVCIVGGGVAGIALALELDRTGVEVCLLESGGLEADAATEELSLGENAGLPYQFDGDYRSRFLGGSSNCWGGWCRPLEPLDFSHRDWVSYSGWPFGFDELRPYYRRTHALLKLGPDNFDAEFWAAAIARPKVRRIPFAGDRVIDSFSQFSPPARLGQLYRQALRQSQAIRVFLYANAVEIETDDSARRVARIRAATLSGRRLAVTAKYFILAAGGIENARLLLVSNRAQPAGLGNGHDLVGRFFMDHPRLLTGDVRFAKAWRGNRLYDIKHQDKSPAVHAHGTPVAAQFTLTPTLLQAERLLNARVWFCSIFAGEHSVAVAALHRFTQTLLHDAHANLDKMRDAALMLRDPVSTLGYSLSRLLPRRPLLRAVQFEIMVEPEPNPASRVTLAVERDPLGLPRARVDWQLSPLTQRTFTRTLEIIGAELRRLGVAEIELEPLFDNGTDNGGWPQRLKGTWHHMGTTRMHDSALHGVVDRDCRVHGIGNLYVAGSSVFPTAGSNFPTMTIAALALRLAGHVQRQLEAPTPLPAAERS
jgi:choline dehydrogenase-like flavoprotein